MGGLEQRAQRQCAHEGIQVVLPAGIAQANTALIYSNAAYTYTPLFGGSLFGTMIFNRNSI